MNKTKKVEKERSGRSRQKTRLAAYVCVYLHTQGDDAPVDAEPDDALLGAGSVHLVPFSGERSGKKREEK